MIRKTLFDRILVALHESTLDDTHWPATSLLIEEACGAKGNCLAFGYKGQNEEDSRIMVAELTYGGKRANELLRNYFRNYFHLDERIPRLLSAPPGKILHHYDLYTEKEKKFSPVYNGVLLRGEFQNGLAVRLDAPNSSCMVWNLANPVSDTGWSSPRLKVINRLLPHLFQYLSARQVLADSGALGKSLCSMLDNARLGVLQLNWRGRIVAASARAAALLGEGDALHYENAMLSARTAADNALLRDILARALPSHGKQEAGGSIQVTSLNGKRPLSLHVSPVGSSEKDFNSWDVCALVLIAEKEGAASVDPSVLRDAFDLTRTESLVAASLAEGQTVGEIAKAWGRSERTVRWHVVQIFQKLGVCRQADLVRRVLLLNG